MSSDEMNQDRTSRGWLTILVAITLVLVVLITGLLFLLVVNEFSVDIDLAGDANVTVEYGESYADPGATAVLRGTRAFTEGFELEVRTTGTVAEYQLGEQEIVYTASFGPWISTRTRTIRVRDSREPVITLFTNDAVLTKPGQPYREEGYIAVDNYDGDITDLVEVTEEAGSVRYTVSDSSGNTVTVIRQIRYSDPE